jgi:hypothetical protein
VTRSQQELIATKRAISFGKLTEFQCLRERLAELVVYGVIHQADAVDGLLSINCLRVSIRPRCDTRFQGNILSTRCDSKWSRQRNTRAHRHGFWCWHMPALLTVPHSMKEKRYTNDEH